MASGSGERMFRFEGGVDESCQERPEEMERVERCRLSGVSSLLYTVSHRWQIIILFSCGNLFCGCCRGEDSALS